MGIDIAKAKKISESFSPSVRSEKAKKKKKKKKSQSNGLFETFFGERQRKFNAGKKK